MEDSFHEQVVDQPIIESKINRREMAKLLGAVTALSASLGVTFVTSAAAVADGAELKLKFLKQSPNGDPAKAELLFTIDVSPENQRKIAAVEGPVELRVVGTSLEKTKADGKARIVGGDYGREVTISSQSIPKAAWQTIKIPNAGL